MSVSLLDRDVGRPVVVTADRNDIDIILAISAFIIMIFLIIMLVLVITSPTPKVVAQTTEKSLTVQCAPGDCGLNIFSGEKQCPTTPAGIVSVNPSQQICSGPFVCDNPMMPYAILPNGSTDISGRCPVNVQCRCSKQLSCASFVTAVFNASNGNPFAPLSGSRTSFYQSTGNSVNGSIIYEDPTTTLCSVPLEFLNRSSPGCQFASVMNKDTFLQCNSLAFKGQPNCLTGTLAFIPDDIDNFTNNSFNITPLACVRGTPCPTDQTPVWDNQFDRLRCLTL